jgi:hypothetical protein
MQPSPVNVVIPEPELLVQNPESVLVIPPRHSEVETGSREFPTALQNLKHKPIQMLHTNLARMIYMKA